VSAAHIEQVANQWRVHDHTTGGIWTYDSEDRAQKMVRALEVRDGAAALVRSTREKLQAAIDAADAEEATVTARRLRKILQDLG
jgi:hypothetical protein